MSFRNQVKTSAQANPDKPFLWHKGQTYSYGDALATKDQFAALLGRFDHVAIISNSGNVSYLSIFSAVLLDATFMHLNMDWHENRLKDVLQMATPDVVICHKDWAESRSAWFDSLEYDPVSGTANTGGIFDSLTIYKKRIGQADNLAAYKAEKGVDDLLYVMFTSGSTGRPKGVPVSAGAATHYSEAMVKTFNIENFESWLQPADLHFDLSMLTVLTAWVSCGKIVAIPANQSPFGPRFVNKLNIDNWTSVPSVIARSHALGMLAHDAMPHLKRSFFCGEALPSDIATVWSDACPNATVYNLYGPTEATVSLTWFAFEKSKSEETVVEIGAAMPGSFVRFGEKNEIELGGPQVFHGYLGNPQKLSDYLETDSDGTRWYKTGDIGALSPKGVLNFKGRIDWQVKIKGYRVEIEGIEATIRKITGRAMAAVVPLEEVSQNSYDKLAAFVEPGIDIGSLKKKMAEDLPDYMVPESFIKLSDFPRNPNGKIDRNALIKIAKSEEKP